MLINPIKQNDVVTLVMNNGSEIVGSFESKDSNGNIKLKKPVALTMTETGAGFVPYSVSGETLDNPIEFSGSSVMSMVRTRKDFADGYSRSTSNIVT